MFKNDAKLMNELMLPTTLFVILSPGFLLDVDISRATKNINSVAKLGKMKTSMGSVVTHSLVFALLLDQLRKLSGLNSTKMSNVIVPTILFILLSPGVLLTVEPIQLKVGLMDGKTSIESILTHAVVLMLVYKVLRKTFPEVY